jgi:hypothetical protein
MSPLIHRAAFPVTVPTFAQSKPLDISSALDVEQIDTDLFRSRSLHLPYASRGVFGGQVISQSLVVATKSVTSDFALHVSFVLPPLQHTYRLRILLVIARTSSPSAQCFRPLTLAGSPTFSSVSLQMFPCSTTLIVCEMAIHMPLALCARCKAGKLCTS